MCIYKHWVNADESAVQRVLIIWLADKPLSYCVFMYVHIYILMFDAK